MKNSIVQHRRNNRWSCCLARPGGKEMRTSGLEHPSQYRLPNRTFNPTSKKTQDLQETLRIFLSKTYIFRHFIRVWYFQIALQYHQIIVGGSYSMRNISIQPVIIHSQQQESFHIYTMALTLIQKSPGEQKDYSFSKDVCKYFSKRTQKHVVYVCMVKLFHI